MRTYAISAVVLYMLKLVFSLQFHNSVSRREAMLIHGKRFHLVLLDNYKKVYNELLVGDSILKHNNCGALHGSVRLFYHSFHVNNLLVDKSFEIHNFSTYNICKAFFC